MSIVVNTNIGSLNAQRSLAESSRELATAMERLSSGKKINSASDDAAGFAMSAVWNPWASEIAKPGDFQRILLSQALFGARSMVTMPLCMYRLNSRATDAKKKL